MNGFGRIESLTPREIEVLKLIATGLSTKEIARALGITFKTAACHRARVMAKLDIHEVANLTRYAIRKGYVDLGGNGRAEEQEELYERVSGTEARYRQALEQYSAFLKERESLGLANPDSSTGARRLRQTEEMAHKDYHAALVALKNHLIQR
jgi:DNA-binding CsgD family transcriptional regulator